MEKDDRDRLIKMETDVQWIRNSIDKHLKEHFMLRLGVYGALLSAGIGLLVSAYRII
jgi:hypothetical protein